MLPIRIMTRGFKLLGEIDRYESLQLVRSWHGIGAIDLRINRYLKDADKLQRGNILFPHNHLNKAYEIRFKEIELDENGKATENWVIRALALKSWFDDRITIPPVGSAYDRLTSDAETIMRHYVQNNVINPIDVNDKMADVALAPNLNKGSKIEWQSRYKVLSEELEQIGMLSGLGWNIDIDYEAKRYLTKVLEGRDLTVNQSERPPAIFSPEFGTLKELSYVESDLDYKNFAVVAGQGEGVDRRIVTVGDASGAGRRVLFVDARDVEEETDEDPPQPIPVAQIEERLRQRGLQKLAEHQQEVFLEGQVAMGRVVEKVPKLIEGEVADMRLDAADLHDIRYLQPISLAKLSRYKSSRFTFIADTPVGTTATVEYSLDNETWYKLKSGDSIPFEKGVWLTDRILYLRQRLSTPDPFITPAIHSFAYEIKGYTEHSRISTARLEYGKDYDLGDLVTLQNKEWGVTMNARITGVKEIYEPVKIGIELTFGDSRPTLISKIKQELSPIRSEVRR